MVSVQVQVAKELVALHSELRRGDLARLERLRRTAPAASSASRREQARQRSPTSPGVMCIWHANYRRVASSSLVPDREARAVCSHATSAALATHAHARLWVVQSPCVLRSNSSSSSSTRRRRLF